MQYGAAAAPDGSSEPQNSQAAGFVADAIQALINLDAAHLETMLSAAAKFSRTAALDLPMEDRMQLSLEMQRFSAILVETRRNLMLLSRWKQPAYEYGYTERAEKIAWQD